MSYLGNNPTSAAFPFDQFSGTGSATSFTLTYAPAGTTSIIVAISGVMQNPNLYSVIGTTLSFSPAPPAGTNNISVLYLGLPVVGTSSPGNTAFMSSTDLTATSGQTVFASAGAYTPGFVQVFRNGARLGNADFTATNGTTITLAVGTAAGDLVSIQYYTLTSLVNALPLTGGTVTGSTTFNTGVNLATVSGNVGIGTTSPAFTLDVSGSPARFARSGKYILINPNYGAENTRADIEVNTGMALSFTLSDYERFRIDTSGRVTMPYQPAFTAYLSTSAAVKSGTDFVMQFDDIRTNIGNHYSASTGRFTAPVSGTYQFCFSSNISGGSSYINSILLRNGSNYVYHYTSIYTADWKLISWTDQLYLSAGDHVSVRTQSGGSFVVDTAGVGTAQWTQFTGHLIG